MDTRELHTHPVAMAYPGVERAPRSDTFHDTQGITQQTNGASGDMDRFSRYIGERFAQTLDEDVDGVCAYIEETKGIGRYTVEASRLAFANYRDQGLIRTFSPQPDELIKIWDVAIEYWRTDFQMKGSKSIVRPNTPHVKGTLEAMEDKKSCIKCQEGLLLRPAAHRRHVLDVRGLWQRPSMPPHQKVVILQERDPAQGWQHACKKCLTIGLRPARASAGLLNLPTQSPVRPEARPPRPGSARYAARGGAAQPPRRRLARTCSVPGRGGQGTHAGQGGRPRVRARRP
mmetsp:Transcript_4490/g.14261  ORF Transcript_4490/g.14261 Transcript_4490/m.14261 type:complete len:287 (+) Transcript_4490:400-1260(+)